jgi:hypothetical protein
MQGQGSAKNYAREGQFTWNVRNQNHRVR